MWAHTAPESLRDTRRDAGGTVKDRERRVRSASRESTWGGVGGPNRAARREEAGGRSALGGPAHPDDHAAGLPLLHGHVLDQAADHGEAHAGHDRVLEIRRPGQVGEGAAVLVLAL